MDRAAINPALAFCRLYGVAAIATGPAEVWAMREAASRQHGGVTASLFSVAVDTDVHSLHELHRTPESLSLHPRLPAAVVMSAELAGAPVLQPMRS